LREIIWQVLRISFQTSNRWIDAVLCGFEDVFSAGDGLDRFCDNDEAVSFAIESCGDGEHSHNRDREEKIESGFVLS